MDILVFVTEYILEKKPVTQSLQISEGGIIKTRNVGTAHVLIQADNLCHVDHCRDLADVCLAGRCSMDSKNGLFKSNWPLGSGQPTSGQHVKGDRYNETTD